MRDTIVRDAAPMRRIAGVTRAAVAAIFSAALLASPLAQAPDTSAKAVTAAAAAYVAAYQKPLSLLLADEEYTQVVFDGAGKPTARRTMTGEFFVTYVDADRMWVSVHDVATVDGRKADGHEALVSLLQRESVLGVASALIAHNAQYNIGRVTRNFNEPTLGLVVLTPRYRPQFKFERAAIGRADGPPLVTIGFKESGRPTLVRGVDGSQVFSSGDLVVEAGTGRVHRTRLEMKTGTILAQLTTTYTEDAKLGMLVPSVFTERYEQTAKAWHEVVVGEARYTNFRRFEVNVRIK